MSLPSADIREFSARGGMIQFVAEQNKVRFDVNLETTGKAGLVLGSEFLRVPIKVRNSQLGEWRGVESTQLYAGEEAYPDELAGERRGAVDGLRGFRGVRSGHV